jgi:tRNA U34 2-thiouridine synthase MnmA/TrmU
MVRGGGGDLQALNTTTVRRWPRRALLRRARTSTTRAGRRAIGIPHYVLDYESRFREAVIEEFADSYLRGETPIPCVRCNQTVKFRDLLDVARDLGAERMATGPLRRAA